jgi:hypothetical protein
MSNYEKHAMTEFRAAGWTDEHGKFKDEMQEAICKHVLELLDVFHGEGHSGTSAPYTIDLFKQLASFEPIAPLTGEDWEWHDTGHNFQNIRASHVFKDYGEGQQAYDINGYVFWEWLPREDGTHYKSYYTCRESKVYVNFPYTPKSEYVYRYSDASPPAPPQTEAGLL